MTKEGGSYKAGSDIRPTEEPFWNLFFPIKLYFVKHIMHFICWAQGPNCLGERELTIFTSVL